jgi:hypothetical protein
MHWHIDSLKAAHTNTMAAVIYSAGTEALDQLEHFSTSVCKAELILVGYKNFNLTLKRSLCNIVWNLVG